MDFSISKEGLRLLIIIYNNVVISLERAIKNQTNTLKNDIALISRYNYSATSTVGPVEWRDGAPAHLLDVALNVQGQVEEELEPLQHVEGVARGVGLVLAAQHFLEERVGRVART